MFGGLTTLVASEAKASVKQQLKAVVCFAAGGLAGAGALAAGTVALHQWLSQTMPALHATLWIAGGYVIAAILLMLVGSSIKNRKRERSAFNVTALALAPSAARVALKRMNVTALGIGGVVALGALLGRKLGK